MNVQEIRQALPLKLQQFRKAAGLTTIDVGEMIGKSYKTVSGWEHGRGQPDADMLFKLCKIYKVGSISEFYTSGEPDEASEDKAMEDELVQICRSLNSTGKTALMAAARAFAGNPDMQK